MAEYALLSNADDSLLQIVDGDREFADGVPPDASGLVSKGIRWVPVVRDPKPSIDAATQNLSNTVGFVDPNYVFGWSVTAKTQTEIDDEALVSDRFEVRNAVIDLAEIVITHIDAHLAKGNLVAPDFNAATRQKYLDLKTIVDRIRDA
jgi:hypothetical protein